MTRKQKQPSYLVSIADWLWARVVAALLWPLHVMGQNLIYSKIQSAIGISKVIITNLFIISFFYIVTTMSQVDIASSVIFTN